MIDFENNLNSTSDLTEEEKVQCSEIEQALKSNPEQCIELLEKNKDSNILLLNDGMFGTWFHKAAKTGSVCVAEFMLEKGFDINTKIQHQSFPYTALTLAAEKNQLEMVKFLVERGATFDTSGVMFSPVMCAIDNYKLPKDDPTREEIIKYLIEKGFDLSVKYPVANVDGFTGAYERALESKLPIASYILEKLEESVGKDGYKLTNTPWKPSERDFEKEQKDFEQYQKYQDMVCDVMISRLKEEEFFEPLYALVIEVNLGERYELNLLYNTESACEEGQHKFYPYQFDELLDLEEEESFFKENDELSQFFGSIIWHEYNPDTEPDDEDIEAYSGIAQNGLIPEEKLPKDTFELLEITAIHCAKRLQKETDFIPKTEDFQLYVVPDSSMAKKDTFISQTVKKEDLHLFEGAFD